MQLIYRGYSSDYAPKTQRYIKPHAINWRYQVPGETYEESIATSSYSKPRAINWRYQTM
ncbi:MAG: hypothetical protein ACRDEA_01670 [Microcystaceae cyanobacterium]